MISFFTNRISAQDFSEFSNHVFETFAGLVIPVFRPSDSSIVVFCDGSDFLFFDSYNSLWEHMFSNSEFCDPTPYKDSILLGDLSEISLSELYDFGLDSPDLYEIPSDCSIILYGDCEPHFFTTLSDAYAFLSQS